jgi:hypothetical protein
VNFDQTDTSERTRFDVVDITAQSEKAFEGIGDIGFDLLRRHTRVKGGDHHDRDLHRRKQIHGHLHGGGDTHNRDNQTQHDDEIRIR